MTIDPITNLYVGHELFREQIDAGQATLRAPDALPLLDQLRQRVGRCGVLLPRLQDAEECYAITAAPAELNSPALAPTHNGLADDLWSPEAIMRTLRGHTLMMTRHYRRKGIVFSRVSRAEVGEEDVRDVDTGELSSNPLVWGELRLIDDELEGLRPRGDEDLLTLIKVRNGRTWRQLRVFLHQNVNRVELSRQ